MALLVVVFIAAGCGFAPHPGTNSSDIAVDQTRNGQSLQVHVGDVLRFTLDRTTWTFGASSDPAVLVQLGQQAIAPAQPCYPGMGCGTTTARYRALAAGSTAVSATRISCGEARMCVGDEGVYRVTVVVDI